MALEDEVRHGALGMGADAGTKPAPMMALEVLSSLNGGGPVPAAAPPPFRKGWVLQTRSGGNWTKGGHGISRNPARTSMGRAEVAAHANPWARAAAGRAKKADTRAPATVGTTPGTPLFRGVGAGRVPG